MKSILLALVILTLNIFSLSAQTDATGLIKEGIALHDEGKFPEAIQRFEAALKLDPKNFTAQYEMANTYINMQEYEKAIKYADKVIDSKLDLAAEAYILKGTAYDMMKKPEKAIKAYEEGIKLAPKMQLLHFNLGVTYFGKNDYEKAEKAFIESVSLQPTHASSHLLLGYVEITKGNKIKGLLALYNFLLLEPKSKRSQKALMIIEEQLNSAKTNSTGGFDISLNKNENDDVFSTAELLISMADIADKTVENTLKDSLGVTSDLTPAQRFTKTNSTLFKFFQELKEKRTDFWWQFYVQYYIDVEKNGYTPLFSNYIRLVKKEQDVMGWLEKNKESMNSFNEWMQKYLRNGL